MSTGTHLSRIRTTSQGDLVCDSSVHLQNPCYTCNEIDTFINTGLDRMWIRPGDTIGVPLVPGEKDSSVGVEISRDPIAPEMFPMRVVYHRELGGITVIDLGLWSPGEGRKSIRTVIWNMMAGALDPRDLSKDGTSLYTRCPNPAHGLQEQNRMVKNVRPDTTYKTLCLFHIVFEKMCSECLLPFTNDDKSWGIPAEAENWQNA